MSKFIPNKEKEPKYKGQSKPKLAIKVEANGEPVTLTEYDLMAIVSNNVSNIGKLIQDMQAVKDAMGAVVDKSTAVPTTTNSSPQPQTLKLPKLKNVKEDETTLDAGLGFYAGDGNVKIQS